MNANTLLSFLSALMALLVFERLLYLLAPGARRASRWIFTGLLLALAPAFLRLAWSGSFEDSGLLLLLMAMLFGLRGYERNRLADQFWTVLLAVLAFHMAHPLFVLLLPMLVVLFVQVWSRRGWLLFFSVVALGLGTGWLLSHLLDGPGNESVQILLRQWSVIHYAQTSFPDTEGTRTHLLPNAIYVFYPLTHPIFCAMLPALLLLSKKTDLALSSKKIVLACMLAYLVLLGGLPQQNTSLLLPAYALLLLLLFPAWDRFYCYGFIFFKKLTLGILLLALTLQLFFSIQVLAYGWH